MPRHDWIVNRLVLFIWLVVAMVAVACAPSGGGTITKSGIALEDVRGVGDLQARLNADVGKTRLLLLVSPT
jgi:hypothetical protein